VRQRACRGPAWRGSDRPRYNIYDYISKLCKQQAEIIQSHENEHVRGIWQGEARHRKYNMLKLGGGQAYYRSCD
jgi:hypothetical protein